MKEGRKEGRERERRRMIKTVNISPDELEDLRTHLIQKQIDIINEIDLLKHQLKITKQLTNAITILVYKKE